MSGQSRAVSPFIAYLLGYPGVGKLTVGQALAEQTGAVVVDNHLVNNPILALFKWEHGKDHLPREAFARTAPIRDAVFSALEEIAPRDMSYVLTNVLGDVPKDIAIYRRLEEVAKARGAVFLPVMVTCARETHRERVRSPERSRRQKLTDPDVLDRAMDTEGPLYSPDHPNLLTIDTTDRPPSESAAIIVRRLEELS